MMEPHRLLNNQDSSYVFICSHPEPPHPFLVMVYDVLAGAADSGGIVHRRDARMILWQRLRLRREAAAFILGEMVVAGMVRQRNRGLEVRT